jgi:hypothetical protein
MLSCAECDKKLEPVETKEWTRNGYIYNDYCHNCYEHLIDSCNKHIKYGITTTIWVIILSFLTYHIF